MVTKETFKIEDNGKGQLKVKLPMPSEHNVGEAEAKAIRDAALSAITSMYSGEAPKSRISLNGMLADQKSLVQVEKYYAFVNGMDLEIRCNKGSDYTTKKDYEEMQAIAKEVKGMLDRYFSAKAENRQTGSVPVSALRQ